MNHISKTTFFSCVVFLLGLACFTLCAIALGTTRWSFVISINEEHGLFEVCPFTRSDGSDCMRNSTRIDQAYIRATSAFMILGIILVAAGVFASLAAMFEKGKQIHLVMGVFYIVSSIFLLIACSVYTGQTRVQPPIIRVLTSFGYSLWLAWSGTILSFLIIPFAFLARRSNMEFA